MQTYVMLTRLDPQAMQSPSSVENLERNAVDHIKQQCPDVEWLSSYALLGPFDYLDIFRAQDINSALKVSALIRSFGRSQSEIWGATEWENFKNLVHSLPRR